jgi:hypothetical protein
MHMPCDAMRPSMHRMLCTAGCPICAADERRSTDRGTMGMRMGEEGRIGWGPRRDRGVCKAVLGLVDLCVYGCWLLAVAHSLAWHRDRDMCVTTDAAT